MNNADQSEPIRYFAIIALTTTFVVIIDLFARAFFYEQTQSIVPFLPLSIGTVALCVMGIMRKSRKEPPTSDNQSNAAAIRRVRVTGPVK